MGIVGLTYLAELLDESCTALGVGVTAVHETVDVGLGQPVGLANLNELEEMVERRVYTAVRGQTHQVEFLAVFLGIAIGSLHLGVLHDGAILAGAVDLHKVLINDASGTDIQVTHLRVTHLSVGQTYILTRSLKL